MALPYPIASSQTDAKSPVDDNLMDSVRLDLDYLDSQLSTLTPAFQWNVNGRLFPLKNYKKAIDLGLTYKDFTPNAASATIKRSGISGNLSYDIRRHASPKTPIIGIDHQLTLGTQSISNVAPALATQSIARSTTQIATQSISFVKSALTVNSIIQVPGTNRWRYNLSGTVDADYKVGDSILFSGCTTGANNGTFVIVEVNQSGFNSVVISNASGVAQTGSAGTGQLQLLSYNYTNPVSSQFVVGEQATFASHTTGANNGALLIYGVNVAGNNVLVKNPTGVVQAGIAGTLDVLRWTYTYLSAPSVTDFIVGEKAKFSSHTSGVNDGSFRITAVGLSGGNNLVVYNINGVAQGGVAGAANTNRWIYALPSDPTSQTTVGDIMSLEGHTTAANNGFFAIKEIKRLGTNNLVFYNEAGVVQAGAVGNTVHTNKLIKFSSDQSAVYTTDSYIEMIGLPVGLLNESDGRVQWKVNQVNRGGGANYNVVIQVLSAIASIPSPAGYIKTEMKSIFSSVPVIAADVTALQANDWIKATSTSLVASVIPGGTTVGLYILEMMGGAPEDFSVTLY